MHSAYSKKQVRGKMLTTKGETLKLIKYDLSKVSTLGYLLFFFSFQWSFLGFSCLGASIDYNLIFGCHLFVFFYIPTHIISFFFGLNALYCLSISFYSTMNFPLFFFSNKFVDPLILIVYPRSRECSR
jgi:hypothetical protein